MSKTERDVARITAPEVWNRLRGGEDLLLVCACGAAEGCRSPGLPGALTLTELRSLGADPRREIVFFCPGPGDEDSVRRAEEYRRRGHALVRCVEGGAEALRVALERPPARPY